MKDRKNRIGQYRQRIDDVELPDDHRKRFEALLDQKCPKDIKRKEQNTKKIIFTIISIAAACILVFTISRHFLDTSMINDNAPIQLHVEGNSEKDFTQEFAETNQYFTQQMNQEIENIKCKLPYTDTENREQLSKDIDELLKSNQEFLTEIEQSENPELAINYLVKHYQINLATLEFINEKLGKYIKC